MSDLEVLCNKFGITIKSKYIGHSRWSDSDFGSRKGSPHLRFDWECTLTYQDRSRTFDYHTGIGCAEPAPGWRFGFDMIHHDEKRLKINVDSEQAIVLGALIPKPPTAADVVYCLISDASATGLHFEDWCSDFGANVDSIKDKKMYDLCRELGIKFRQFIGDRKAFEQLAEAEH